MTVRDMVSYQIAQQNNNLRAKSQEGSGHKCGDTPGVDWGIEGMCLNCYGEHANDIVELPDSVTQQIKNAALRSAKDGYGVNDRDDLSSLVKSYIRTVPVDKRLATSRTMQKTWFAEVDRIGQYIHSQDPNWKVWGQKYDLSILDNYQQGIDTTA
jgi:hypothetical protein